MMTVYEERLYMELWCVDWWGRKGGNLTADMEEGPLEVTQAI
jgi:hypothetical protein